MIPKIANPKRPVYLDYASTTPVDPAVTKKMLRFFSRDFGNPSALYRQGREAAFAVEHARKTVAEILSAKPEEIVFTSGGTESINLGILGFAAAAGFKNNHFITTQIEHSAVLECYREIERRGGVVEYLPVASNGTVDALAVKKALRPNTVFVSVMYANNETGAIQPVSAIGKFLRKENDLRKKLRSRQIVFHTDACQAAGFLEINVQKLGIQMLSANGSKLYGPKGCGILFKQSSVIIDPQLFGGGQERGYRSGTENVAEIVGFAESLAIAVKKQQKENTRIANLRNYLMKSVQKRVSGVSLNGPEPVSDSRLPNNVNICISGVEAEALLLYLDAYGIAVSTGSACSSRHNTPSHVLKAMGKSSAEIGSSIRITLGRYTTKQQIDYFLRVFERLVPEMRNMRSL